MGIVFVGPVLDPAIPHSAAAGSGISNEAIHSVGGTRALLLSRQAPAGGVAAGPTSDIVYFASSRIMKSGLLGVLKKPKRF